MRVEESQTFRLPRRYRGPSTEGCCQCEGSVPFMGLAGAARTFVTVVASGGAPSGPETRRPRSLALGGGLRPWAANKCSYRIRLGSKWAALSEAYKNASAGGSDAVMENLPALVPKDLQSFSTS